MRRANFPGEKYLKYPYFWSFLVKGVFTFYSNFVILLTMKVMMRPHVIPKDYTLKPMLEHLDKKFWTVYTPECDVSVDESLMMWKGCLSWKVHIPSKCVRFGIKLFQLCEAKSGYVWNFIYSGQDTVFEIP
jgi:hypothetical protein